MEKEKSHPSAEKLSSYGLDELTYWIYASPEKFNLKSFAAAIGEKDGQPHYHCRLKPRDAGDYGVQIGLWDEGKEMTVRLDYRTEGRSSKNYPSVSYADDLGNWLAQFFKYGNTHVHIHGHFSYPLASRTSKFPLPLKTSIEDAEIDGISLRLPAKPEGVMRVRLTQGRGENPEWYVEVIADRRMTFKSFSPHPDIRALLSVLSTLLEERKP